MPLEHLDLHLVCYDDVGQDAHYPGTPKRHRGACKHISFQN